MAVTINSITISSDKKTMSISVDAGVGQLMTAVNLWTESTFKDLTLTKDFSSKLAGNVQVESFTILASDLSLEKFDGLYFLEFENNNSETSLKAIYELTEYEKCGLDKTLQYLYDNDCSVTVQKEVLNIDIFITQVKNAIDLLLYSKALELFETLKALCAADCETCPKLKYLS